MANEPAPTRVPRERKAPVVIDEVLPAGSRPGESPWISGTGARPTLQALPDGLRPRFEAELKRRLREAYPEVPIEDVAGAVKDLIQAWMPKAWFQATPSNSG